MTPLLTVSEVSVSFGGLRALDQVSLEVEGASIVGLIGPNGAGKTTLFNVVSGLQRASGTVSFDSRDLTPLPAHRRARLGIGRTFQNLGLMRDETVRTNLLAAQHLSAAYTVGDLALRPWRWWRSERDLARRLHDALDGVGLAEHLDTLVSDVSFGTARFVELAAALLDGPRLLLLDEPTTGLDVTEVEGLRQLLVDLRDAGTTVLVVAHDVRFVMGLCDVVYVLTEGRNLTHGPAAEIQRNQAVIDLYLGRAA